MSSRRRRRRDSTTQKSAFVFITFSRFFASPTASADYCAVPPTHNDFIRDRLLVVRRSSSRRRPQRHPDNTPPMSLRRAYFVGDSSVDDDRKRPLNHDIAGKSAQLVTRVFAHESPRKRSNFRAVERDRNERITGGRAGARANGNGGGGYGGSSGEGGGSAVAAAAEYAFRGERPRQRRGSATAGHMIPWYKDRQIFTESEDDRPTGGGARRARSPVRSPRPPPPWPSRSARCRGRIAVYRDRNVFTSYVILLSSTTVAVDTSLPRPCLLPLLDVNRSRNKLITLK